MLTLVKTADGSSTLFNSEIGEHYHSRHGALQESRHVFVHSGLEYLLSQNQVKDVKILEVGFGTGLNFLLSARFGQEHQVKLNYAGIEAYPLAVETLLETGYDEYVSDEIWRSFIHEYPSALKRDVAIHADCRLRIVHDKLLNFSSDDIFDIIYFDAFAAVHQPEMWQYDALSHICNFLKPGGLFVTYAITGNLKRTMKSLGFSIEKAPGAPGKREMLRAVKLFTS